MDRHLIINDLLTPIGAFIRLRRFQPVFLFESAGNARGSGRYSFIGLEAERSVSWRAGAGSFVEEARRQLDELPRQGNTAARLPAGLVGFTGLGLMNDTRTAEDSPVPDALLVVPRYLVVFDHLDHRLSLHRSDGGEVSESLAREMVTALRAGAGEPPGAETKSRTALFFDEAEARERITAAAERMRSGECQYVPVAAPLSRETGLDPFQIYRGLRYLHPSPYLYYLSIEGLQIMGSSPESLVTMEGDRVRLSPCSAVRPRTDRTGGDAAELADLAADPRAAAEHAVIVEQTREDLARIAAAGTMSVGRSRAVELSSHEMHLVTDLVCQRADGLDHLDVFGAVFPAAGSISIPKGVGEPDGVAGLHGGAVGYFSVNGAMDFTATDRALLTYNGRCATHAVVRVDSETDPEAAARSLREQGAALLRSLAIAQECL